MTTQTKSMHNVKKLTTTAKIYIARGIFACALFATYFFLISGRWDYERAWIYYITSLVVTLSSNLYLAQINPELLDKRSKIRKGTKKWDVWWLVFFGVYFLHGLNIIAGLDLRYNEPQFNSVWIYISGVFLYMSFTAFTTWAMAENRHFETSVRIQDDRDHKVITTGPYKYVRHPGYTGILGWSLGFAFMIGSIWALYAGIIMIFGVILRTYWEDQTLQKELIGYKEYTSKVKYRLIPGIW